MANTFAGPHYVESVVFKGHVTKIGLNKINIPDFFFVSKILTVKYLAFNDIDSRYDCIAVFGHPETGVSQPASCIEHLLTRPDA